MRQRVLRAVFPEAVMKKYLLALALILPALALAQVPQRINYQGYLTNAAGVPVSAVLKLMTFRLYDTPTGGRALWEETQSPVTVANGVFNVVLGSVTPIILPFDAQYYLGVQANDDGEMKPRQALATSPYAFRAGSLDPSATIAGSQITGAIAGATMPGVAPWVAIGGTSQLAVSNTAYMVTGATPATITMPAAPAVGDVVKVSSQGLGGWTLVPNTGQAIEGANVPRGVTWTPRESARFWWSVASSADGAKLAAVVDGGQIYTSTDSGVTWTPRDAVRPWRSVASSADGYKVVAVAYGGRIYTANVSTTISGGQSSAAELVYAGDGRWLVVSQQGSLTSP
jgi:hypothetical protein